MGQEEIRTDRLILRAFEDPHAEQLFGCKAGQPMVKEQVCRVW